MLIVWLLTGLWHGAVWKFILWSLYYFLILYIERTVLKDKWDKLLTIIQYLVTFLLINFGWRLFRVNTLADLKVIFTDLITNHGEIGVLGLCNEKLAIIFSLIFFVISLFCMRDYEHRIHMKYKEYTAYQIVRKICLWSIFVICILFLVSSTYNSFIYF